MRQKLKTSFGDLNMTTMKFTLVGLAILSALSDCNAQPTPGNRYKESYYAYWGYGIGGQKNAMNFGFVLELKNNNVLAYSLQKTWMTKTETVQTMSVMGTAQVSPVKQTTSASSSLLFGKIVKQPWGHFLVMAGPSLVKATHYDSQSGWFAPKYSGEDVTCAGVSLQASVTPSKNFIGFSTYVFVNINSAFTYGGVTLNIVLGKVNYRTVEKRE